MNSEATPVNTPPVEQTPAPAEQADVLPSYDSLTPPPQHSFRNPRFDVEEGGEGEGVDLPPPYSPTIRPDGSALDAPPDYYSLFGQIRDARNDSHNSFAFLQKLGQIIINTVGCTVLLVVFMSIPISMLVLGALNLNNCILEPNIPIFLVIGGFSGTMKNLILITENILRRCAHRMPPESKKVRYVNYVWKALNFLFNLFLLGWIIAGSYWIYHIYPEVNTVGYHNFTCNELLYKYSFGILTSSYILLTLTMFFVCCCGLCLRRNRQEEEEEEGEGESGEEDEEREWNGREGESDGGSHESGSEERSSVDGSMEGSSEEEEEGLWRTSRTQRGPPVANGNDTEESTVAVDQSVIEQGEETTLVWHPPGVQSAPSLPDHQTEMQLSKYTASPILSPSHRFRSAAPSLSLTPSLVHTPTITPSQVNKLYVTHSPSGYSCTAV